MPRSLRYAAVLVIAAAFGVLTACTPASDPPGSPGAGCGTWSLAVVDDDSQRAGLWALENGEVTSDLIESVEVTYLQIPALIGATGTDQYDAVQTAIQAVPRAIAGGLDLEIIQIGVAHTGGGMRTWVRADSPLETDADLAGKTVGLVSLGSTGYLFAAKIYQDTYGLDPSQESGDVRWTELDPPTLLNALKQGHIDAANLPHYAGWQAENDPQLRALDDMDDEYRSLTGQWPVGSAITITGAVAEEKPECVSEFQRLLDESVSYATANIDTIAPEVSVETGVSEDFIKYWWAGAYEYGGLDDEWLARGQAILDVAQDMGAIDEAVDIDDLVFEGQ